MMSRVFLSALIILVMVSALTLVTKRYDSRALFIQSEQLQLEAQELDVAWRHLQSERSELARNARINQMAKKELELVIADLNRTIYIQGQVSKLPILIEP